MDINQLNQCFTDSVGFADQGHWESGSKMNVDNHGFIYCIRNDNNNRLYIGKKQYKIGGKKFHKKKGKRVENRRHGNQSDWKDYTSSSKELNEDIISLGKDSFTFLHLRDFETKGGHRYHECNLLHKLDALTAIIDDGTRLFYNKAIDSVKYIPKEV